MLAAAAEVAHSPTRAYSPLSAWRMLAPDSRAKLAKAEGPGEVVARALLARGARPPRRTCAP